MQHGLIKHDSIKLPKETSYVGTYNDIISAIASGANKVNEIADKSHVEQSVAVHACKHYTLICGVTGKPKLGLLLVFIQDIDYTRLVTTISA